MIIYETNKSWLRDLSHLARSWTMQKIMRSVGLVGLGTAIICVIEMDVFEIEANAMVASIYSLLGIVLSLLLVFRTNSAYDRWWEGRKQWGALVNHCRNLAVNAHAALPRQDLLTRKVLSRDLSNFCFALKEHLRSGVKMEELVLLSEEEKAHYATKKHLPNYLSFQVHLHLQDAFRRGDISEADLINLKPNLQGLLDVLGACERIKKTPIPFSYNVFLKLFITVYTLLLPFGFIPEVGYWAIPLVMLVFFAFIGVEMMGEEIEDPFGLDCNDLPTGSIAQTIYSNVCEILNEGELSPDIKPTILYEKVF